MRAVRSPAARPCVTKTLFFAMKSDVGWRREAATRWRRHSRPAARERARKGALSRFARQRQVLRGLTRLSLDSDACRARFTVIFAADGRQVPTRQTTRHSRRSSQLSAPVLRRLQIQQARARAALEHEQAAVVPARLLHGSRRRAALGRGLGGRAHRRQRGTGPRARTRRQRADGHHARGLVGAGRGADPGVHHRRASRHHAVPGVAQGQALASRERADPREGADARAHALRGLGVLRQADARAPRSLEPAAVAGDAHLGPVPERASPSPVSRCCSPASRPGRWSS